MGTHFESLSALHKNTTKYPASADCKLVLFCVLKQFQCPSTPQENSTSSSMANSSASSSRSPVSSSSKGKQIAGICIAVLICIGGAVIVGNYFYRRMKRKEMIRFEDYGYSRLKMLEDDFYFDVEDDGENTGLVQA